MISKTFRLPSGTTQFEVDLVDRLNSVLKEIADQFNTLQGEASLEPVTSIVNAYSDGSKHSTLAYLATAGKKILSGELLADTYKTLLTVTDSGVASLIAATSEDATTRTMSLKVLVDGTSVFESAVSVTDTAEGIVAVGCHGAATDAAFGFISGFMPFSSSLVVQVKSDLAETDKLAIFVAYHTT